MGAPVIRRLDAAWVAERLTRALATLAAPPAKPHIERSSPVGALVARFVLPLELCLPLNRFAELKGYARKRIKDAALLLMLAQLRSERAPAPLPGRRKILCLDRVRLYGRPPSLGSRGGASRGTVARGGFFAHSGPSRPRHAAT
jgi:hypothetical protein